VEDGIHGLGREEMDNRITAAAAVIDESDFR
jgi:hypothetical protein